MSSEFGIIGLGVMGKSLTLNMASKGVKLSVYNRHIEGKEEGVAQKFAEEHTKKGIAGFDDLKAFVNSLEKPRRILLMITAGDAVDQQIDTILPFLEKGDVLIDGGNSFFKDTSRRSKYLKSKSINYLGTGISGGEEGALKGPAIMPGGDERGYNSVSKYLDLIAAKDKHGKPCSAYIGPDGAGHFVKMVHNGIEYAEMQLLAETYAILRNYLYINIAEIVDIFKDWKAKELGSYLLEITIDILQYKEDGELLLDKILDQAEQKGTGWLSAATALEYGVPYDALSQAVMARNLSSFKEQRTKAANHFNHKIASFEGDKKAFTNLLKNAYSLIRFINHDNGFNLISTVFERNNWNLNLSELARVWTNGCIIRSVLMENLVEIFKHNSRVIFSDKLKDQIKTGQEGLAEVISKALKSGLPVPVYSAALNYLLGWQTENSPANLIQAQRDYFGAHTYKRTDKDQSQYFHTNWKKTK